MRRECRLGHSISYCEIHLSVQDFCPEPTQMWWFYLAGQLSSTTTVLTPHPQRKAGKGVENMMKRSQG